MVSQVTSVKFLINMSKVILYSVVRDSILIENIQVFTEISYSLNFSPFMMGKKSGGTLSYFHRTEGEKECSSLFPPSVRWGKRVWGYTVFPHLFPICKVGKKSGGYIIFPHL